MMNTDQILCECPLVTLEAFVEGLESSYEVQIAKYPSICTTMIRAEDSVEGQLFYLGEALMTESVLLVNGQEGHGLCLGDEPVRSYCIAFMDALLQLADDRLPFVHRFLEEQDILIREQLRLEYNLIQRTKVDFKLMEQD
jgi:alpha-D-ribose 1-methylphosphonate 5-triphosphate synthase subunit PhnG